MLSAEAVLQFRFSFGKPVKILHDERDCLATRSTCRESGMAGDERLTDEGAADDEESRETKFHIPVLISSIASACVTAITTGRIT